MKQNFVFDKDKLEIAIEDWSDTEYFVVVKYDGRILGIEMSLCEFESDCEWWGFEGVRHERKTDGAEGWIFQKTEKKGAIEAHITGFVYQYSFLCRNDWV